MTLEAKEHRRRQHEALSQESHGDQTGQQETDLYVHEALARLPADYRRVLESKYLKQLTMKQLAQAKGLSIEALESLLRRARDRFAQVYQQVQDST
jgi:RNA polymerase sigma factor (sigma-70 family)